MLWWDKPAFAMTRFGAVHLDFHPCSKLQGIQANKLYDIKNIPAINLLLLIVTGLALIKGLGVAMIYRR